MVKPNVAIYALLVAAILSFGFVVTGSRNAYAVNCNTNYGQNCYAVDVYEPFSSVNGIGATYKVKYTSVPSGWINQPVWLMLVDGTFIEVGWIQPGATTNNPQYYWGSNGGITNKWGTPADESSHTFRIDDLNQDKSFKVIVDGVTKYTKTMATSWSNDLETGYEYTYTETTVESNHENPKQMGRTALGGWVNWDAANAYQHYKGLVPTTGNFVK